MSETTAPRVRLILVYVLASIALVALVLFGIAAVNATSLARDVNELSAQLDGAQQRAGDLRTALDSSAVDGELTACWWYFYGNDVSAGADEETAKANAWTSCVDLGFRHNTRFKVVELPEDSPTP